MPQDQVIARYYPTLDTVVTLDEFNDLTEVPYGDGLFYRVTVSREVEYADLDENVITEYAPSQASKIVASTIVEVSAPASPTLRFQSMAPTGIMVDSVSLIWPKAAYNARYHVYKMNNQGNWVKIHELQSNDSEILLSISDTDLGDDSLKLLNETGDKLSHHFKVIAENTSGMLSNEENILTIFNEDDWTQI